MILIYIINVNYFRIFFMKLLPKYYLSLLLLFCAPTVSANFTGFIEDTKNLKPISQSYSGVVPKILIDDPDNAIIIIYSHGNGNVRYKEDCSLWWNAVPDSLLSIESKKNVHIYYLCSSALDTFPPGSWIYDRVEEINKVLDELLLIGVKSKNIFLSGHSAGGWASLMAMNMVGKKFNAGIIFAPACCGPRSEILKFPSWRRQIRPAYIKKMINTTSIEALIFSYKDDPYNRPRDLLFLSNKFSGSIEVIGYSCGNGHLTHIKDCKLENTKSIIWEYIQHRLE